MTYLTPNARYSIIDEKVCSKLSNVQNKAVKHNVLSASVSNIHLLLIK